VTEPIYKSASVGSLYNDTSNQQFNLYERQIYTAQSKQTQTLLLSGRQ